MAITLADFNKIWASTSPLTPYSFSESNYKQGWNFIGSTPPARQMWDFLQKNNDEKMQYLLYNFIPANAPYLGSNSAFYTQLTSADDLNNITTPGTYWWNSGGGKPANAPNISYAKMFVINGHGSSSIIQIAIVSASGDMYRRALNGTWNDWKRVAYAEDVLPLSGGTVTGGIYSRQPMFSIGNQKQGDDGSVDIRSATGFQYGALLSLYGVNHTQNGKFVLQSSDGTRGYSLIGTSVGGLSWNGQPVQTTSDKRLKQDFSDVPDEVLEAWGKVNWKQFKYKADVERKGDSCRFHTGLVAQDVKEVGEENNVDLLKYGILCHDVREAVEEEKDEDGNIIREASEAVDLWTVRYEEALAMEVIYLRNEIKKLHEEIKALRTE